MLTFFQHLYFPDTTTHIPCIYKLLQNMLKLSKYNQLIQL